MMILTLIFLQIYPDGIRHIRSDKRVNEWKTPGKKTIVKCAVNQRQVVIALTGGELVYFEMDPVSKIHMSDCRSYAVLTLYNTHSIHYVERHARTRLWIE